VFVFVSRARTKGPSDASTSTIHEHDKGIVLAFEQKDLRKRARARFTSTTLGEGTNEIQRLVIARQLLQRYKI